MHLRITVTVETPTLPDAELIAKNIPPAFAAMAGGNPSDITVSMVNIEMVPVAYQATPPTPPAPVPATVTTVPT